MKERLKSGYVKMGITVFAAGAALIVLYEVIIHFNQVQEAWSVLSTILSPFIFGLVMAYLLCPVYNVTVRRMYRPAQKAFRTKKTALRFARVIGTVVSLIVLFGVIGGLFALVLPETLRSIIGLIQVMPDRFNDLIDWLERTFTAERNPEIAGAFESVVGRVRDAFMEWSENDLLPLIGVYMSQISQGVIVTLRTLLNILIGVIVCVYFLNSKETFKAQARKTILATMSKKRSDSFMEFAYFANRTFGGFINGKLIDSLIIGILCFILMSILKLPYTVLVSTIVGVTNFIPFFGPFIGAIPSAIIICFSSPIQAVYFLIMILGLQQFDGNILGPKILGETTGLASFWVMFAIIVGGGLFGFLGMVLGVPVFAMIYYYGSRYIENRLKKKKLPVETEAYQEYNQYDIDRKDIL
ncbi:MAG: AI-2E family transporter [Anaerovoracaceae bacterium]